ncbi:MAG: hypothetical protein LKH04_04065 [Lachnospiraceae bacterium]|jgi:hypothetical protein|nr:hypothetical protein [Lachnospiraceae bacterium]MCI1397593.1 hypothetical protein [Lachnospiraceae bacterium]MCI1423465.1 hypothetical protein [Lachnospiraceae bacterium]MCI1451880.1 hypothetical protein [Lachnospiraceae bacterium]
MRRKIGIRILSVLFTAALAIAGILIAARVTMRTDSDYKTDPFLQEDTDVDVLFLGTSHVINGIFPMQLWEDYGITSYNLGGHGITIATSYWILRNAVEVHKPKVAVLDVSLAESEYLAPSSEWAHDSLDAFPLTKTKIQAVQDLYPDDKDTQNELLFPFVLYHSRWTELSGKSIVQAFTGIETTTEKGAESRIAVSAPGEGRDTLIPESQKTQLSTPGMSYIQKLVEYCRQEDITPVLINVPYPATEEEQEAANGIADLAKKLDVPYLNLQYASLVDFDTDLYDADAHLNPSGARKVTAYLGEWLTEHTDLQDHRDDPAYTSWDTDYEAYRAFLTDNITQYAGFAINLMLLNNENFTGELTLSGYEPGTVEQKLIDQLGENLTVTREDAGEDWNAKLVIRSARDGSIIAQKTYGSLSFVESETP